MMTERKLERTLVEMLDAAADDEQPALANAQIRTFEDAGLLTRDRGIVLTLEDGSEFQITIIQSAGPDDSGE